MFKFLKRLGRKKEPVKPEVTTRATPDKHPMRRYSDRPRISSAVSTPSPARTETVIVPAYNPMLDPLSPLNPISPLSPLNSLSPFYSSPSDTAVETHSHHCAPSASYDPPSSSSSSLDCSSSSSSIDLGSSSSSDSSGW